MTASVLAMASLAFALGASKPAGEEARVRHAVESFYAAFNAHDFALASEYAAEDWNHINPFGGLTRGRENVLKELTEVHSTILEGVSVTTDEMAVRFASPVVAVVTVINRMGTYYPPDGIDRGTNKRENERQIRTFVVVKKKDRWLVMQDQNTVIRE